MTESPEKRSYKTTLNLPKTAFAMKADLVQKEPASLKRWNEGKLYEQLRQRPSPRGRFAFHDGPPYANGSIHLGHLLNKTLKDFVVRSRSMAGYDVPYVPGWDCHGQPIEHKVVSELGDKARAMEPWQIRRKCRESAEKFIKLQKTQMQRLLTLADYDHPYITMDPAFEAATLEVFADMVGRSLVYRMKKAVHWSIANQTALADAELEYYDRQDTSVYVLFEVMFPSDLPRSLNVPADAVVHLMIWTTTPWTLPANMAVAVLGTADYGLYRFTHQGRTVHAVLAQALAEKVLAMGGATGVTLLGSCAGRDLERSPDHAGVVYKHPLQEWLCPVVTADYVTLEDGTGMVHTAPGHGQEDFDTGRTRRLHFHEVPSGRTQVRWVSAEEIRQGQATPPDIYCPVLADGVYDDTVPLWLRGMDIWTANGKVVERLTATGLLFHAHTFTHSYPHDWRGKTPVIFRATEQWFVNVDQPFAVHAGQASQSLRQRALKVTAQDVKFVPEWGRNRMRGMLESRPDWCISRQRNWGLPIPAFFDPDSGQYLLTRLSVKAVADKIRQHGSDYWFRGETGDLLDGYSPEADPDCPEWLKNAIAVRGRDNLLGLVSRLTKSSDIFDVWFESGSSWHAVMVQRGLAHDPATGPVTDLYLEGSDQHRGWFQLSLLPCLGVTGQAPFRHVLTHGWTVDKEGRKMSKSLGNTIEVEDLLKEFGADVCRWWVTSINTENDIKADLDFFRVSGEEYRKLRNTIRFLLSNLFDFNPQVDRCHFTASDAASLDAWALGELAELIRQCGKCYEEFNYRRLHDLLFNFCNTTLSAVYLAATKDRLYCDRADSARRRRTQTAMYDITDALIRLLAPILPHTADEAWTALHGSAAAPVSVHLALFPEPPAVPVHADWARAFAQREPALRHIEQYRQSQGIDNPLDLGLRITATPQAKPWLAPFMAELPDLLGISRVELIEQPGEGDALTYQPVDLRQEPRCERSWKRDGTVKQRSDGGMLSDRDAAALGLS